MPICSHLLFRRRCLTPLLPIPPFPSPSLVPATNILVPARTLSRHWNLQHTCLDPAADGLVGRLVAGGERARLCMSGVAGYTYRLRRNAEKSPDWEMISLVGDLDKMMVRMTYC